MKPSPWSKTPISNLVKYKPSGTYFIRAKILGKIVRRSLKTKSFAIAKVKLNEEHRDQTQLLENQKRNGGSSKMASVISEYETVIDSSRDIKASTRKVHRATITFIKKTWPELPGMDAQDVTMTDCERWSARVLTKATKASGGIGYSSIRHNTAVMMLRAILKLSIKRGLRLDNPARTLSYATITKKDVRLPSMAKFLAMLEWLETKGRTSTLNAVRYLAYSGMRSGEAGKVTKEMIDWQRSQFLLPGSITKSGKPRPVPIIAELRPFLIQLIQEQQDEGREGPLLPYKDVQAGLDSACRAVGTERITHHDLRHLFITRCIESGVDVKTIATWVGHQDGGALILKTYAHLRNEHSQAMAAKVTFTTPLPENAIRLERSK